MLSSADLLVLVVDGTAPNEQDLEAWVGDGKATPQLWVWNKCDLAPPSRSRNWLATSATQGTGIAELLEAIFRECIQINVDPSAAMPLTEGQCDTLRHVEQAIRDEKWLIAAQSLRSALSVNRRERE